VLESARRPESVLVVASQGLEAQPVAELEFPGDDGHEGAEHEDEEHEGESELAHGVEELVHHAEEGEVPAIEAIDGIRQLLAETEHDDGSGASSGDEHEDEELSAALRHILDEGQLTAAAAISELEAALGEHGEEGEHSDAGHGHLEGDPHFWQDPTLTINYVERIRDGLVRVDPANRAVYTANAAAYILELQDLDREIAQTLNQVPPERRHLVTFHDAFGYFARRYGWEVSAFVPSDASRVTPVSVVEVMRSIESGGIPAVFAEPQFRADVLEQAARDTGVRVGTIYSDSLDETVPTYIEMMRFNANSLAEHLR
jgi:ABC-type Zn uptake system ZnuABC Zn-binding protein ZnuA